MEWKKIVEGNEEGRQGRGRRWFSSARGKGQGRAGFHFHSSQNTLFAPSKARHKTRGCWIQVVKAKERELQYICNEMQRINHDF